MENTRIASFDEMITDLKRITNLTSDEIIEFVRSQPISYNDLRVFFLGYARLPTNEECNVIHIAYKRGVSIEELRDSNTFQPQVLYGFTNCWS